MPGSSLQFWHFPVYGEDAYVLEGRHDGLVGTKALGEENGPCLLYGYDYGFVFGFLFSMSSFASQWMLWKGFPSGPAVLMEVSARLE